MASYAPKYPDGAIGLGLLLLRSSSAVALVALIWTTPAMVPGGHLAYALVGALSFALLAGIATRLAAAVSCVIIVTSLFSVADPLLLVGELGGSSAMLVMGPGAFSLDARLYGRRVISLQPNKLERVDDE